MRREVLSLSLLFLLAGFHCLAQISSANIIGQIQDGSGASISQADLHLINSQTGTERETRSGKDGRFVFTDALPGGYLLRIQSAGFATTQVNGLSLGIGDTRNIIVRLKIGPVSESVDVDAKGTTPNFNDSVVSTIVDRRFVSRIPLNGRSFQDLISMTPGIVTQTPQAGGGATAPDGDFSTNGQKPLSNAFYVDGVAANLNLGGSSDNAAIASSGSGAGSTALGTTQSLVSIDALQEFQALTSTYSAEYGRVPGGQFNFLSRSGTNDLHGSAYNYWRGNVFDAPDWFAAYLGAKDFQDRDFSQNDFGGTLSAPLRLPNSNQALSSTFLFLSYEHLLLRQQGPVTLNLVPSLRIAQTAPSTAAFLHYFPRPSSDEIDDTSGNASGLGAYVFANGVTLPAHLSASDIRVDKSWSQNTLFFRYGNTPSNSASQSLSNSTIDRTRMESFTFGMSSSLSRRIHNELHVGYLRGLSSSTSSIFSFTSGPSEPTLAGALGIPSPGTLSSATILARVPGVGGSRITTATGNARAEQWNERGTLHVQLADHLLRLGVDHRWSTLSTQPTLIGLEADYLTRQALAVNAASYLTITRNQPSRPHFHQLALFAQDEWRVVQALTLSFGLRWEYANSPKGREGQDAYSAQGDPAIPDRLLVAPRGTPLWKPTWSNLAPRAGLAWRLGSTTDRESVLRAGGGLFYDSSNQAGLDAFRGAGFSRSHVYQNAPLPVRPDQLSFMGSTRFSGTNLYIFPEHLRFPVSAQWSLAFEQALGKNQTLTISYIGSHGSRLLQAQRRNVTAANHDLGDVTYFPQDITSDYHSLQLKFQRTLAAGVQILSTYTWAHALDYGSTSPFFPLRYGNSDYDVRHNFELGASWDLPRVHRNSLKYLFGDWGLDGRIIARSAFPLTLFGNLMVDQSTGENYWTGVDLIAGHPLYLYGEQYPGGRILNGGPGAEGGAFRLPVDQLAGTAARNFVRGFPLTQVNLALHREMPLVEPFTLQLRAEMFNVANHPNFGYIDPTLSEIQFGRSTRMLNQSFGPNGPLYQQGGPRSVQLSIRFTF